MLRTRNKAKTLIVELYWGPRGAPIGSQNPQVEIRIGNEASRPMFSGAGLQMDARLDRTAKLPGGNATLGVKFIARVTLSIARDIVSLPARKNAAGAARAGIRWTGAAQHLSAIAQECGPCLGGANAPESSKRTARSTDLQAIGRYIAKDVPEGGAVPLPREALLDDGCLHGGLVFARGQTLAEDLKEVKRSKDQFVVHPGERLPPAMGGIVGHCGNLAQQCAIVKVAGMADLKSPDAARCFDGEEACFEVVKNKRYREGEVLVIRYEGPQRGPGMRVSSRPAQSLIGEGWAERSLSLPRWSTVRQVSRTHTGAGIHSSTARKVCHARN